MTSNDLFTGVRNLASSLQTQFHRAATGATKDATDINKNLVISAKGLRPEILNLLENRWQDLNFYKTLDDEFTRRIEDRIRDCRYEDPNELGLSLRNIKMFTSILESNAEAKKLLRKFEYLKKEPNERNFTPAEMGHLVLHSAELLAIFGTGMAHVGHVIAPITGLIIQFLERQHQLKLANSKNNLDDFNSFLNNLEKAESHFENVALIVYRVPDFWPHLFDAEKQAKHRKFKTGKSINADESIDEAEAFREITDALQKNRDYHKSNSLSLSCAT